MSARSKEFGRVDKERYQHDQHGNVTALMDGNNNLRTFEYDDHGILAVSETVVFPGGEARDAGDARRKDAYSLQTRVEHHDVLDLPVAHTDWRILAGSRAPQGPPQQTLRLYDSFGQVIAEAFPGDTLNDPTTEYAYEFSPTSIRVVTSTPSRAQNAGDVRKITCFDGLGRKLHEADAIDAQQTLVSDLVYFNARNSVARAFQPFTQEGDDSCAVAMSHGVLFERVSYDALNREMSRTRADAPIFGTPSRTAIVYTPLTKILWDESDLDAQSPHAETPQHIRLDGQDRVVEVGIRLQPGQAADVYRVTYDDLGNMHTLQDPHGNLRVQEHDSLSRVVRRVDSDSGQILYDYDRAGNLIARTDARGVTAKYTYDAANRPLAKFNLDAPEQDRITWTYDAPKNCPSSFCTHGAGRLVETSYSIALKTGNPSIGRDFFTYDARGRKRAFSRVLRGATQTFTDVFDNAGRVIASVYPGDQRIDFSLDGAGRPIAVPGFVPHIGYSTRGQQKTLSFANGVTQRDTYDALMRLSTRHAEGRAVVQSLGYIYDRHGNIVAIRDDAPSQTESASANFVYDAWHRLTQATLDPERQAFTTTLNFTYDAIGNLRHKSASRSTLHLGEYNYDKSAHRGAHQVSSVAGDAFHYDASGNLVQRGHEHFAWDWLSRLHSTSRKGLSRGAYAYDDKNQRVLKQETTSLVYYYTPSWEFRDGAANLYITLGGQQVARLQYTTPRLDYFSDGNHDGAITLQDALASLHGDAAYQEQPAPNQPPRLTFLHRDHLGSLQATTNESGAVEIRLAHAPFGEPLPERHDDHPFTFTGQERDRPTGLSYHAERYYDARTSLWLRPDPLILESWDACLNNPTVCNPYTYASGNPVSLVDPSGELPIVPIIIGAIWVADAAYTTYTAYQDYKAVQAGTKTTKEALIENGAQIGIGLAAGPMVKWGAKLVGKAISAVRAARAAHATTGGLRGAVTWGKSGTLADHFARHGADFGSRTADEYAEAASNFLTRSQADNLPTKIDSKGVIRVYDPKTNTFGSYNADGTTRTFYKPDPAAHGQPSNLDYWNKQPGVTP